MLYTELVVLFANQAQNMHCGQNVEIWTLNLHAHIATTKLYRVKGGSAY
jgi:hypothetical protein